ncbi:tripartite tricarboxylate transporter TctB family protein [Marinovum sp.]|uniref:tripartite tricarboxylate transporter TctB family protein n=1 Tax=Marinovum sp. TaxID=2024839 RepID=UPI002B2667AB|nr:tripartite tricarboxylate transporter TctB family protein [Marinovum sp.]
MIRPRTWLQRFAPFDVIAVLLGLAFLVTALRTPPEAYDVIGARGWPLAVALGCLGLLALRLLVARARDEAETDRAGPRFWLFCSANTLFVVILSLKVLPFFVTAAIFSTVNHLLLANTLSAARAVGALAVATVVCFALQALFTGVIYVDL